MPIDRFALDHVVLRKIFKRDERPALLQVIHEFLRHLAVVEIVGVGGNPLERARQFRLLKGFARAIVGAIPLKQQARLRKARQVTIGKLVRLFGSESESVACQFDGRAP